MRKLRNKIKKLGWNIYEINFCDGIGWELAQHSPAGEDFAFVIQHDNNKKQAIKEIKEYAENFDEDEHIEMWVEAKHCNVAGIPTIRELVQDAEDIHNMLYKLAKAI